MTEVVEQAATALDTLATSIRGQWAEKRPMAIALSQWNVAAISTDDLASRAEKLAERVRTLAESDVTSDLRALFVSVPERVTFIQGNSIPQLPSSTRRSSFRIWKLSSDRLNTGCQHRRTSIGKRSRMPILSLETLQEGSAAWKPALLGLSLDPAILRLS
jgi:hypothetical protein